MLVDIFDISGFIGNSKLDKKIGTSAKKKDKLESEESKIIKLQAFDPSYFHGKKSF